MPCLLGGVLVGDEKEVREAGVRDAEPWDNVGLILGDPAAQMRRVLLCIDLTAEVVEEAVRERCDAVVAYHPPIFKDLRKIVADAGPDQLRDQRSTVSRGGGATATVTASSPGAVVFEALRHGIAVYSPHTALDVAPGGTSSHSTLPSRKMSPHASIPASARCGATAASNTITDPVARQALIPILRL